MSTISVPQRPRYMWLALTFYAKITGTQILADFPRFVRGGSRIEFS